MSKLRRLFVGLSVVAAIAVLVLLPNMKAFAAINPTSYPWDKARAFYYSSWLVNCFSSGSYSIDMSGDASVNSMNVGPGNSIATGLTGKDPRKCNDKTYATEAISFLGIPWSVPQDALNFLCDIGARRDGTCSDLNNSSQIALDANQATGNKVKAIINSNTGFDVFAAYGNSKLLQYSYFLWLGFLNQCEAKDNNTSQGLADDVVDVKVLQPDGTFVTERRQYNPNALISRKDMYNSQQVNCRTVVQSINSLAADPVVGQEWLSNYTPGQGNQPGTCEDRYSGSSAELKACQDGFNNKTNANFCTQNYPFASGMPEALRATNAACTWGQSDKATGAIGKTKVPNLGA
ncbi:hypothetical protein IPL68_02820 [Candidatus Saccharibacteria bacterium]|nr:MAG: hypothetical protein IPL68_02820 [Candidatus Saccharibacteria bacterium]